MTAATASSPVAAATASARSRALRMSFCLMVQGHLEDAVHVSSVLYPAGPDDDVGQQDVVCLFLCNEAQNFRIVDGAQELRVGILAAGQQYASSRESEFVLGDVEDVLPGSPLGVASFQGSHVCLERLYFSFKALLPFFKALLPFLEPLLPFLQALLPLF